MFALCDIPVNISYLIAELLVCLVPRVLNFSDLKNHQCQRQVNARGSGVGEALGMFFLILNKFQPLPWSLQTAWFTIKSRLGTSYSTVSNLNKIRVNVLWGEAVA